MDFVNPILPPFYQLVPFLWFFIQLALVALGFFLLYVVVRAAVRRALQDHQLWLDSRGTGGTPQP